MVAAGADPDEIAANAAAYQRQQEAMGNEGTQFILAPSKWLETDAWRGPFPLPDAPRRGGGEDPDAVQAWERLIATDGAERPPAAQIALQAVGGWPRVKERTIRETPILRREFISAFTTASHAA